MNQINKILSGLKKRRASVPPSEPSAGATSVWKGRGRQALIGLAVLVGGSVAGGVWWVARHKNKTVAPVAVVVQAPAKLIATPPVTPPAAAQAEVSGQITQETAASQPVAEAVLADSSSEDKAQAEKAPQENVPKELPPKEGTSNERGQEKENIAAIASAAPSPVPAATSAKPHIRTGRTKREKHEKAVSSPEPENMAVDDEPNTVPAPAPEGAVEKQIKPLTAQEQANNEYIKANDLVQQGRIKEALAGYETALQFEPGYEAARQAMVVLLLQNKRNADAERVLQDGLKQNIKNSGFAMLLARIQLDRNASWSALLTLQKTLPYASQQPDYQAFVAALLQRLNHHKEAVMHYQAAVELAPDSGVWWMGMGISLRALQRTEEARVAFRRALESHSLNGDLQVFVSKQLKEL